MATHHFDTDLLRDTRKLLQHLLEFSTRTESGCLLYPHQSVSVRLAGYRSRQFMSAARIAWAVANTTDHLSPHDFAVHTCEFGSGSSRSGDTRCCIEPTHLIKGLYEDINYMRHRRALGDHLSNQRTS